MRVTHCNKTIFRLEGPESVLRFRRAGGGKIDVLSVNGSGIPELSKYQVEKLGRWLLYGAK